MGVGENFKLFCTNLRMSSETVSNISYRYKRITKQLNKDFWDNESETSNSFFGGSYGRGTDIHVSDIDILFKLPNAKYHQYDAYISNGQSALLSEVKKSIQGTYKTSDSGSDGQVVKVKFTDGINFEIVPVFLNSDVTTFTYPDSNNNGSWKVTNPKTEISEITRANIEWNRNLTRLCRMARAWKDHWDVPISGFLIDTLAYNFMKNWTDRDKSYLYYDFMSRDFFEFLKNQNNTQQFWLAPGSGDRVHRKGLFEHKALRCYNLSKEAIVLETNETAANRKWREVYGPKFPN